MTSRLAPRQRFFCLSLAMEEGLSFSPAVASGQSGSMGGSWCFSHSMSGFYLCCCMAGCFLFPRRA